MITDHKINECNEAIAITCRSDDPADPWLYELAYESARKNQIHINLHFQHGPIKEVGVNGITNEALMAVVLDRLRFFQSGKYACGENQRAIDHLEEALDALHDRTRKRVERGVEGTHTP